MKYVIFASYGNDSVALIRWAKENNLEDVCVLYSDTGWSSSEWDERVKGMENWVELLGFKTARTKSMGLEALVRQKKGWPRNGMQFCTLHLKIIPAMQWLDENDPDKIATCLVGVRREESQNRRSFPKFQISSPNHGGRPLWAPLATLTAEQRDALLLRAGIEPLPHRSMECFPCINANRADLRLLAQDSERVEKIASIENDMGVSSKGKKRTMFRPYRHMGAVGIHEVVRWAQSDRGGFTPDDEECETGYCGI